MFTNQKNHAQFVYHYTSSEAAIKFILKNKNLRFSSYTNTNDPKESKEWFFIPGTNEEISLDRYTPDYLSEIMNPRLKSTTQLLCFSKDKPLTGNHLNDNPNRGFCKPRMWAQYADKHSGICLLFDYKKLADLIHARLEKHTYKADHVEYKDRLIAEMQTEPAFIVNVDYLEKLGDDDYAFSHGQQFQKRLFFEKATDWENEDEFRWVVFESENEIYIDYQNTLKGILFGSDCTPENITKIVQLTKNTPVQYQQIKWRNCTPWFDFGRLEWV